MQVGLAQSYLTRLKICQGKQLSQDTTDTQTFGLNGMLIAAFRPDCIDQHPQAPFFTYH